MIFNSSVLQGGEDKINNSEIIKAIAQNKIQIGDTVYINNEDGVDKAYIAPDGEFTSLSPNSKIGFAKSSAKNGEEVTIKTVGENELLTFEEVGF